MAIEALLTLLALVQEAVPFRDLHPDGKTPEVVGAHLTLPDGRVVLHGPYERFHRNGKCAAKGEYEHGLRTGAWELRHEDGKMRARGKYVRGLEEGPWVLFHEGTGQKASEGSYRAGLRAGKWTFWEKDGKKRDFPSGDWKVIEEKDAGTLRARGAEIESTKDGVWLHLWPNGAAQFVARFELGRLDELFFLHPDGTLDPKWLSQKSLPRGLPEWAEPFVAGLPRAELPLEVSAEARARIAGWLASGAGSVEPALLAEPRLHVPAAIEALRACPLDAAEGRERAQRLHGLLRQLFGGVGWDWTEEDAAQLARRWGSAWELLRGEDSLWEIDFDPRWRWLGHDLASSALLRPPALEEVQLGATALIGIAFPGPRAPFPKETLDRAAAWLVAQQDERGLWRGARGSEVADTALALLVLIGDDHYHRMGEHQATVRRGLLALRECLDEGGALASVRNHALVTWIYAELYALERAPGLSLLVREHAGALLARLGEDGRFSSDAFEDALARFAMVGAASEGAFDREGLARVLETSAVRAQAAREAPLPGPAARTVVGIGLLVEVFGGPRPATTVLQSYADWLERHPPDAQTPPEETVFGAWASMQLGKPAFQPWNAAIEGPLRSGWQADGTYLSRSTAASRLEATCLAALTLQYRHRWPVMLARR